MKNIGKSAFISTMALICYAGFVSAQAVSFDNPGDLSGMITEMKAGGHGGPGGGFNHVPPPPPPSHGGFGNQGGHNGPGNNPGNHNGPGGNDWNNHGGDHNGPGGNDWNNHGGDHNGPGGNDWNNHGGNHNGPGPQPGPWHPQPGPQPGPWHPQPNPWNPQPNPWNPQPNPWHPQPGPQPGPWHPHQNGHPDWDNNDWNNNHWNSHGPTHSGWWNSYDMWWNSNSHPFSMYRTVCTVVPGMSAKGFIVERTMPFYGKATFYYYDGFNSLIGASNAASGVYTGGTGTPVFDFYQVPQRADHCFLAITQ